MIPEQKLFFITIIFRVFNCLLVQTWFVPDEYWQSLEPAHHLAFGFGYLTWEWHQGIRSYLYPLIVSLMYKVLAILSLDYRSAVVLLPRFCQSMFGAVADLYFYKFVKRLFGESVALWTLFAYWLNWFEFFCTPRTLANTTETHLLMIGLCYYPWPDYFTTQKQPNKYPSRYYLVIATFSTILRPTAAVFWLPLCFWHLCRVQRKFEFILKATFYSILPVVALSVYLDRICYGQWLFSLWNFAQFNFFSGGSAHFGVHPWHWYLSNGLPTVCFTHSITMVLGLAKSRIKWVAALCLWYILVHSYLPHKELRFLLPLLPLLSIYTGLYFSTLSPSQLRDETMKRRLAFVSNIEEFIGFSSKRAKALLAFLLVTNLPIALYTCLLHQRGCLEIPKYIHEIGTKNPNVKFWFLTPCHSTPYYSHVHVNITMRFLTCEPNFNRTIGYVDEADQFFADPLKWLRNEFSGDKKEKKDLPSHIIMYDQLFPKLREFLQTFEYKKCHTFFNTDFPQSDRQSSYFLVLCKHS